jgi:hypothetical protein
MTPDLGIEPLGALDSAHSTRLAGLALAAVGERAGFVPVERYARALRGQGLLKEAARAAGGALPLCDALQARGLLVGDGTGCYSMTAAGKALATQWKPSLALTP